MWPGFLSRSLPSPRLDTAERGCPSRSDVRMRDALRKAETPGGSRCLLRLGQPRSVVVVASALFLFAAIAFCAEYRSVAAERAAVSGAAAERSSARWYTVRIVPGPERPVIRTRDKFNPLWWFRNDDQPEPPESYRPDDKSRVFKWHLRNPLHNFTFYVIGVADKKTMRSGRYPEVNFAPQGGWNMAITRRKWLPLPFISYCHGEKGFHFYCGWRSTGVFGFKFNFE